MISGHLLRSGFVIERATPGAPDAANQRPLAWSTLREVSASLTLRGGVEGPGGHTIGAANEFWIILPFPSGVSVTPKDRVRYGSRIFDIESVSDPDDSQRILQIVAREKLA